MKERPILMKTDMVKAVLDGRKTQTRRVIKLKQPLPDNWGGISERAGLMPSCPYGQAGDRLWVRETWNICELFEDGYNGGFEAGYQIEPIPKTKPEYRHSLLLYERDGADAMTTWRPSIHMPRWASRITLEITDVRVERVQEITTEDIYKEGITVEKSLKERGISYWSKSDASYMHSEFQSLWDFINLKRGYGWEVNPWVWVVSFKVVK